MVKGINRQVIVVKSPDPKLFDQAIFLLREDANGDGVDTEQLLRQARQAADAYLTGHLARRRKPVPGAVWGAVGACAASAAWLAALLLL